MDINKSIRIAVDSGKVVLGSKKAFKNVALGKGKLIIIAENCPTEIKNDILHYCSLSSLPTFIFQGTSIELGAVCGKPFPVSALTIIAPGDSDILKLTKRGKK